MLFDKGGSLRESSRSSDREVRYTKTLKKKNFQQNDEAEPEQEGQANRNGQVLKSANRWNQKNKAQNMIKSVKISPFKNNGLSQTQYDFEKQQFIGANFDEEEDDTSERNGTPHQQTPNGTFNAGVTPKQNFMPLNDRDTPKEQNSLVNLESCNE